MGVLGRFTAEQWAAMQNARRRRLRTSGGDDPTPPWSPLDLFADGTDGTLWEPWDVSTLFQDQAGTTPVTAGGDPVGRVLDKSGNSVTLSQATTANRFTAVRMPLTGRRNLLTWTEEFANTAWNAAGGSANSNYVLDNTAIAPNGTMTASHVIAAPVEATSHGRRSSITGLTELTTYRFSFYAKAAEYSVARAWSFSGGSTSHSLFNLLTGETNGKNSAQMLELADGWWRCSLNVVTVGSQTTRVVHFGPSPAFDELSFTGDGVSGIYVWGAQLELGSIATPYQRVTNANDVTEAGVTDVWSIVSDYAGDVLSATLPQAINGEILIAGTKGTIIEPVSYASGSTFNLGPASYTGGTPGTLRAIGPIVGVLVIDRSLTQVEKDQLIAYYKGNGAKGLLVPGPELMVNGGPFVDAAGWTIANGDVSVEDGRLRATANSSSQPMLSFAFATEEGRAYRLVGDWQSSAGSTWRIIAGTSAGGTNLVGGSAVQNGQVDSMFVALGTTAFVTLRGTTGITAGAWGEINGVSVRKLRPQEDW